VSTAARAPGRPRSAEADQAIVRATLEVLLEEGFRGLSVEAVRQRAGVGKATIYRRFPDKEALVTAAVAHVHADVQPPDTGSLIGDLDEIFRNVYAADPAVTTLAPRLLAESAKHPELHAIFRRVLIDPRRRAVREILERGVERGEMRDDVDLDLVIDMIAGPTIYRLLIDGGDATVIADRGIEPVRLLLEGLSPTSARPSRARRRG
jgi:AcrR family transcriptional regulator